MPSNICYTFFKKKRNNLYIGIVAALTLAFFVAGAFTKITYPCSPENVPAGESVNYCTSFEKAVMHPADLILNKQGSLVQFLATFFIASVLLSLLSMLAFNYRHKS